MLWGRSSFEQCLWFPQDKENVHLSGPTRVAVTLFQQMGTKARMKMNVKTVLLGKYTTDWNYMCSLSFSIQKVHNFVTVKFKILTKWISNTISLYTCVHLLLGCWKVFLLRYFYQDTDFIPNMLVINKKTRNRQQKKKAHPFPVYPFLLIFCHWNIWLCTLFFQG